MSLKTTSFGWSWIDAFIGFQYMLFCLLPHSGAISKPYDVKVMQMLQQFSQLPDFNMCPSLSISALKQPRDSFFWSKIKPIFSCWWMIYTLDYIGICWDYITYIAYYSNLTQYALFLIFFLGIQFETFNGLWISWSIRSCSLGFDAGSSNPILQMRIWHEASMQKVVCPWGSFWQRTKAFLSQRIISFRRVLGGYPHLSTMYSNSDHQHIHLPGNPKAQMLKTLLKTDQKNLKIDGWKMINKYICLSFHD